MSSFFFSYHYINMAHATYKAIQTRNYWPNIILPEKKVYLPEVPQPYGKNIHRTTAKCGRQQINHVITANFVQCQYFRRIIQSRKMVPVSYVKHKFIIIIIYLLRHIYATKTSSERIECP